MAAVGSISDGFALPNDILFRGDTRFSAEGKTPTATPRLIAGQKTFVLVSAGQSLGGNQGVASYVPANQSKIDNLSVIDGGMYQGIDPLVGCTSLNGGTYLVRMADKLINSGVFDRVVLVPLTVGGSLVSYWTPGGRCSDRIGVAIRRLEAVGMTPSAFWWDQGQGDSYAGTTQGDYMAMLQSVIALSRSAGSTAPWIVCRSTWAGGVVGTAIQAAQAAVVNDVNVFRGPDIDSLDNTFRYDATHLNDLGTEAVATMGQSILADIFV